MSPRAPQNDILIGLTEAILWGEGRGRLVDLILLIEKVFKGFEICSYYTMHMQCTYTLFFGKEY